MSAKKRGLGRGLDALLGGGNDRASSEPERLRELPIESLQPGKYQPRSHMDRERLQELADSIRAQGLIQPIIVRPIARDRYEIIAGERRWRAAQLAELREVPCVVRESDDHAALAMALIENIQREDLNPLEEALALQRLIDEFQLTHQQTAEAVGRSRAAVSNLLRLLELPEPIRKLVEARRIEMGHARALLTLPADKAEALARQAAEEQWSVREIERRVQAIQRGESQPAPMPKKPDPDIQNLERELGELLSAKVAVQHGRGGRGKLVVQYFSLDELEGILEKIRR
ncbi:ParB/RepB/Spo0J family partition protein [uncultured Aquimonas sp.]|uniref:ParB/RepB/Spo0J family partition protein n=1 Tax=uncultured Aquimonas sp. TaxID=385483 RepID=UPI00086ECE3A|nr:ParB/RepB/Spo0J family partition protein [uncultured Aquimonas sp.]ODU43368.1 MAG: chromosome partitioning protein ParB [Xanthomonadaceae bacterium SCN 69-123]